jgi:hypothetical protein
VLIIDQIYLAIPAPCRFPDDGEGDIDEDGEGGWEDIDELGFRDL